MELLNIDFSGGALAWVRLGATHHAPRPYEGLKICVLLDGTTAVQRRPGSRTWQALRSGGTNLIRSGIGAETAFQGEGDLFSIVIDRDFARRAGGADWSERTEDAFVHDPFLHTLATEVSTHLRQHETLAKGYAESVAWLMCNHLRQRAEPSRPRTTLDPELLRHLLDEIDTHLDEPLTLQRIAGWAHLSPSHFARAFTATVGEPPHRYVLHRRVEKARALLAEPSGQDLAQVAQRSGFSSQSHLTRCFRERLGVTPGQYARKKRQNESKRVQDRAL